MTRLLLLNQVGLGSQIRQPKTYRAGCRRGGSHMVPQGLIRDALPGEEQTQASWLWALPCVFSLCNLFLGSPFAPNTVPSALRNENSGGKQYFRSLRCSLKVTWKMWGTETWVGVLRLCVAGRVSRASSSSARCPWGSRAPRAQAVLCCFLSTPCSLLVLSLSLTYSCMWTSIAASRALWAGSGAKQGPERSCREKQRSWESLGKGREPSPWDSLEITWDGIEVSAGGALFSARRREVKRRSVGKCLLCRNR